MHTFGDIYTQGSTASSLSSPPVALCCVHTNEIASCRTIHLPHHTASSTALLVIRDFTCSLFSFLLHSFPFSLLGFYLFNSLYLILFFFSISLLTLVLPYTLFIILHICFPFLCLNLLHLLRLEPKFRHLHVICNTGKKLCPSFV